MWAAEAVELLSDRQLLMRWGALDVQVLQQGGLQGQVAQRRAASQGEGVQPYRRQHQAGQVLALLQVQRLRASR